MSTQLPTLNLEAIRAAELEEARYIQQAMLPAEQLRGANFEFVHLCRPVSEVGGDFLDYFWLDDRRAGFYLGDVVGKGLPAAMFAALAVGTLRGMHKTGTPPRTVLEVLNDRLRMRVVPGRYCAVLYATFDPSSLELRIANAAMPRPLIISPSGVREIGDGGLPSGLFEGVTYDQATVRLAPGDCVLFASDGLTDARDTHDNDFGYERLHALCSSLAGQPAQALLQNLFAAVESFASQSRHHDDMTATLLRIPPA